MTAILAYGSLLLPASLVGRLAEDVGPLDPVYDGETAEPYRPAARRAWRERYADRVDYWPVRVDGLRRVYAYLSPRGGLMLEARRDPGAWLNGAVVTGLTDAAAAAVTASEAGYDVVERDTAAMEPYGAPPPDGSVTIHAAGDPTDPPADRAPTPTYHERVLRGVDRHADRVGDRFREEFLRSTYVAAGGGWRSLADESL